MYLQDGELVYSPSDLTLYLSSPFASWMDHFARCYPELAPEKDDDDGMNQLLQQRGDQHERAILEGFVAKGLVVVDVSQAEDPFAATVDALHNGADVIFQAALRKPPFQGYADFLIKVPGASDLGDYHYEVWDTKLSKSLKPYFTVQLCCYQDMLAELQGRIADEFVVVLGNGKEARLHSEDYRHYYHSLKRAFLDLHTRFDPEQRPDPADSRDWGRWRTYASQLLLQADHLSQVATITQGQIKKLNAAGIQTVEALINHSGEPVSGVDQAALQRLQAQAAIQRASDEADTPAYEVIVHSSGVKQGLALLPPHSDLDVFFDIEGYPLMEGGLEYLWGSTYFEADGTRAFKDFWAHDHGQEKQAFSDFIRWVYDRWQRDPGMHIYHYANYEIAACRKLMSRYGVCEHEVDQLLRNEVFVDLYKVVKGGLLIGEPRYSIKNVEHLYRGSRDTEVGSGGDSVVVYERWREQPDGSTWQTSSILNSIRDYNIDDCDSTQELVEWLRARQIEHDIQWAGRDEVIEADIADEISERLELRDRLLRRAEPLKEIDDEQARLTENLAWSLEFHRREAKPVFWRLFDRLGQSDAELLEDLDCVAACQRTDRPPYKPSPRARNQAYEFRYDPNQDCKLASSSYYLLGEETDEGKRLKVSLNKDDSDPNEGLIVVTAKDAPPDFVTLVPDEYVNPNPIPQAIEKVVRAFEQDDRSDSALMDFLRRRAPRIAGLAEGSPIAPSQEAGERLQQIIQAALNLEGSYLPIQGPPGAGKTFTGKHIIAELLRRGKTVGISSNSHKAINNLLIGCAEYCRREGIDARFGCTKETDSQLNELDVSIVKNNEINVFLQPATVVGTTAWGFSREDLSERFDYLFIDEAGQVSIANLIGMSQCTRNLILMGDQMQLGQPAQGTHPAESGLSILDYLLHEQPTIPDHMGIFLGTTYRMHSKVNAFSGRAIYAGKLESHPDNDNQFINVPEGYQGPIDKEAGIVYLPVHHEGNVQASDEEVEAIVSATRDVLGRIFTDKDGSQRPITYADILYVAPYNFQVNKLRAALGPEAKIGSVDKFQGQEAPVVFLSMCTSDASESPRGMEFLFDRRRINVAVSRAQCLVVVVANPSLQQAPANTIEQQRQVNLFCGLVQAMSFLM